MEATNSRDKGGSSSTPNATREASSPIPNEEPITSPSAIQASENGPPQPSRAQQYFEEQAKNLPPLFPQRGSNPPPPYPLVLPSPTEGFQVPLSPFLLDNVGEHHGNALLTPISPPTQFLDSPGNPIYLPLSHRPAEPQSNLATFGGGIYTPCPPVNPNALRNRYGKRNFATLHTVESSNHSQVLMVSSDAQNSLASGLNLNIPPGFATSNISPTLGPSVALHTPDPPFPSQQGSPRHNCTPNHEAHTFAGPSDGTLLAAESQHGVMTPANHINLQHFLQNNQALVDLDVEDGTCKPVSESPLGKWNDKHVDHPISQPAENPRACDTTPNSAIPSSIVCSENSISLKPLDPEESIQGNTNIPGSPLYVPALPEILIDRPLVHKVSIMEQRVVRTSWFSKFITKTRQSRKAEGVDCVGGTIRKRSDLIKVITNLQAYGYPSTDREDVHKILDVAPGLSKESVGYLKNVAYGQLESVKCAAQEALFQFSGLLVNQLRYRVMDRKDILTLQCKVVDRFVVSRNCILEKYTQYVRNRKWIENMSTNQRRGCLTHKQNNILRMWLYCNYNDPYPDEETKTTLMRETALTQEQVNNWLINARSRFWKPCMDYFDRECLEKKMAVLIRHREKISTEKKLKSPSYMKYLIDAKRKKNAN